MTDEQIQAKIEELKNSILDWTTEHKLDVNITFYAYKDYFTVVNPNSFDPCVLVMSFGGEDLYNVVDHESELSSDFFEMIQGLGFWIDMHSDGLALFFIYDDELTPHFQNYYEWEWICELLQPDYTNLHEEIFERIAKRPDDLHDLDPRKFEIFLDEVFQNNGYRTELGPGQGDGGVDIRLYSNDIVGEALTLVQVKRYKAQNPIGLEAVQALSAAVTDERANRGLFVTTSRYLPGVHEFANRQNKLLTLADKTEVQKWSDLASKTITQNKSQLVTEAYVSSLLTNPVQEGMIGKIVHASIGVTMIMNKFAIVLKENNRFALLMRLRTNSTDPYRMRGYETPIFDASILENLDSDNVFRVRKEGNLFLDTYHNYTLWNGQPLYFDHAD